MSDSLVVAHASSPALWEKITALLARTASRAGSDARHRQLACDESSAELNVEWWTPEKSPLYASFDRSASTVVLTFGEHQSISDYEVTEENFQWYEAIIDAVASGGWAEEYFRVGLLTVCRAVLTAPSGPVSFHEGLPCIVRFAGFPRRVHRYSSWSESLLVSPANPGSSD